MGSGGTSTLEVVITDANGNQNNKVDEIISVTAMSSNMAVATVAAMLVDSIVEDIDTGEPLDTLRQVFVEVTGVAAGTVDITGSVETSEGTFDIGSSPATVLNPIITPATPSGGFASTITINGSGFLATGFETLVLVDGLALGNVTVVSDTEIEAQMPTFGTAGTFDLVVSVGGVTSDADTWTQTDAFDATATEPDNDDPGLAPVISVPFEFSGSFAGAPEEDDFFFLTVSDDVTVDIDLEWTPAKDLDILVTDGAFTAFVCTDGATGAAPEHSECDLDAGDYLLWLNDFDAFLNGDPTPVTYTVRGTRQ